MGLDHEHVTTHETSGVKVALVERCVLEREVRGEEGGEGGEGGGEGRGEGRGENGREGAGKESRDLRVGVL